MAKRTRSEIVGFAVGGAFLVAFLAVVIWLIAARFVPGRDGAEIALSIDFAGVDPRAERVDELVTPIFLKHLGAVEGLDFTVSVIRSAGGKIILKFKPDVGREAAIANARLLRERARPDLPPAIGMSSVAEIDASARRIAYLGFSSARRSRDELTEMVERIVKPRLQEAVGVAEVRILGAVHLELRIRLDNRRLAAFGISAQQVEEVLRKHQIEIRAELGEGGATEFAASAAHVIESLQVLAVGQREGVQFYLRDVADFRRGLRSDGIAARFNGRNAVILEVVKRPEVDPAEATRGVRDRLAAVIQVLPEGVDHEAGYFCSRCALVRER
jgi:multidrug efflux pump